MASTKSNLSPQQIATLIPPANPQWVVQGTYTPSALGLPPMGGRIRSIYVPIPPGLGDPMTFTLNGVAMASVIYAGSYEPLCATFRAQTGVQASWVRSDGFGIDVVFTPGSEDLISIVTMPVGTVLQDITEGVSVASVLRAGALLEFAPLQALLVVQDITYTATLARRGTAGNAVTITYVVAGALTPLSVAVVGTAAITVNMETDAGANSVSTALEVFTALQGSEAAMRLVTIVLSGNPVTVQVAAGVTPLAGGAATTYTVRMWVMTSGRNVWGLALDTGPLTRPQDLIANLSGTWDALEQSLRLDLLVDGIERVYVQPTAIGASGSLTVRIGTCPGT